MAISASLFGANSFLDACRDRRMSEFLGMSSLLVTKTGMTTVLASQVTAVNSISPNPFLPFPVESEVGGCAANS